MANVIILPGQSMNLLPVDRDSTKVKPIVFPNFDSSGVVFQWSFWPLDINSVPVISVAPPALTVCDFFTQSLNFETSGNHDYFVPGSNDLSLTQILASASGQIKVQVLVGPTVSDLATQGVFFNTASNLNISIPFSSPILVPASGIVRITITNIEKASAKTTMSVYSSVLGELA